MPKFYFEVNNKVDFYVDIYDTPIGEKFYAMHKDLAVNHSDWATPFINDDNRYTIRYLNELIDRAQKTNTVDWTCFNILHGPEHYAANQLQFNDMHKDLEVKAGIEKYAGLDGTQRKLVDEMHWCLHSLEKADAPEDFEFKPRDIMQMIYRGDYVRPPMPAGTVFDRKIMPGEVMLDFPYVGKEPMTCLLHKDNSLLRQTCKVIDHISFTWKMHLSPNMCNRWAPGDWPRDVDAALTQWAAENQEDLDYLGYTPQFITQRAGFCIVGKISDTSKLTYIRSAPTVDITQYYLVD
jgi:hypothetical protein